MKKLYAVLAALVLASMVLAACAPAATPTAAVEPTAAAEEPTEVVAEPTVAPTEAPAEPTAETAKAIKVCQVTDTGGIDDKSFNATAWKGAEDAATEFGAEAKYLESQQQTDYEKHINSFMADGCDLIVTVGFLLGDATKAAAEANPDQKFAIVDYGYDPEISNVLALTFATDQAAFLAGYAAAAATKTGIVGTFGGLQIPTVTVFMDGFALGVQYYNEKNGTDVQVLGWDPATQEGLFAGNFESTDDGRTLGQTLLDEGADIIMPVAGPVGLGTAAAVQEHGNAWIIGVDYDWTVSADQYKDIILTSVLKAMDTAVLEASRNVNDGTFAGGTYVGTLENGGVGLAELPAGAVSDTVLADLETIKADIIAGTIKTAP
jgi:basic membrane protein A